MKIAIIGGGASGIMLGGMINSTNAQVTIFEKTDTTLKKLLITGNGRCNVTNLVDPNEFIKNVAHNQKFLYSSIFNFSPADMVEYLNVNGLATKAEDNNRIFPVSNKAMSVKEFLDSRLTGVDIKTNSKVDNIEYIDNHFVITSMDKKFTFDIVVVATGGLSYPTTGSSGDGLKFAQNLGLSVTPTRPSLCAIRLLDDFTALEGTPFECELKYINNGKIKAKVFGNGLFTSFGVSGPAVFKLSAIISEQSINKDIFSMDFCSELNIDQLKLRIKQYIKDNPKKYIVHLVNQFVTMKIAKNMLSRIDVQEDLQCACVSNVIVDKLSNIIKNYNFVIDNFDAIERATVTRGGVDVRQINPHTMECTSIPNLYFIGEVLDVDAFSGGFNLQIAFSTAVACACDIKNKCK